VTVFENFSIVSSYVLIQKETILNKKAKILKSNSSFVFSMNTVLTEHGHIVYEPAQGRTGYGHRSVGSRSVTKYRNACITNILTGNSTNSEHKAASNSHYRL
jgi:hypothetical protein